MINLKIKQMKTNRIKMVLVLMIISISSVFAQETKTEKIDVKGNCGMCEKRIEKAALELDGVKTAVWNVDSEVLKISFDESKTSINIIEKRLSELGHDTDLYKAENDVYDALPACCKYR